MASRRPLRKGRPTPGRRKRPHIDFSLPREATQPPPHRRPARDAGRSPHLHVQQLRHTTAKLAGQCLSRNRVTHAAPQQDARQSNVSSRFSHTRTAPRRCQAGAIQLPTCHTSGLCSPHSSLRTLIESVPDAVHTRCTTDNCMDRTINGSNAALPIDSNRPNPQAMDLEHAPTSGGGRCSAPP